MDQPTSDAMSQRESRLWRAAARHLVDDLPVSVEDTLVSYERLQAAIQDAGNDIGPVAQGRWKALYRVPLLGTQPLRRSIFKSQTLRQIAWSAGAGVVIGAAVIVAGWKFGVDHVLGRTRAPESVYTTYVTANGQRATIMLPDGNRVALDVASRLEVPTNYGAGNHAVRLPVGEALFLISHHAGTPFTVMAGSATARVLGTTFLVRHYGMSPTTVAVAEGKVAVGTTVVTAQRQIEIGRTGTLQTSPADASQFSFATGILTLNSVRLSDAVKELNRWYDADIRLGDSALANRLVYGKFTAGSLADLSEVLEWTFAVHVVRVGRVLTLYPRVQ